MSRLDYGNAVLVGLPAYLVQRLQSVLNAAARVIFHLRSAACITDVPATLNWLHIPEWIKYKIALHSVFFTEVHHHTLDRSCQYAVFPADGRFVLQAPIVFWCHRTDKQSTVSSCAFKLEIDLVQKILKDYTAPTNTGKSIVLCWIPSFVNIPGTERADAAAKSALSLPITNMKLPGCELIPHVSRHCLD